MSYAIHNNKLALQELDDIKRHINMLYEESIGLKQDNIRLNNIIKEAIEYHNNCIENLDLDKIDDNERLAYKVAYGIHNNYLKILKGE